jgi:glucose-6-phosphate isomerase
MANLSVSAPGVDTAPPADLARRVWAKDAGAWGPGDDDPADRLGWLTLPDDYLSKVDELRSFATEATADVDTVVLLGMGGSSLAPEVFARSMGPSPRSLVVGDSTHPAQIVADTESIDLSRALFVVSSKSGGTVETMSLYAHYRSLVPEGARFIAITDPGTSLQKLAEEEGFRRVFENPPDIGGRYSALSWFGLVPAALAGVDAEPILSSAAEMAHRCGPDVPNADNPGAVLGTVIARLAQNGRDKLTFLVSESVVSFGDWVEQLLAESTGKQGRGIVPIVREPLVDVSAYGSDRAFVLLKLEGEDALGVRESDLTSAGHPAISMTLSGPEEIGAQMFMWEFATAVAGSILGINAFDQPNVESAKKVSRALLESGETLEWADDAPAKLWQGVSSRELGVICAFAPRTDENAAVLARAREKLLRAHGVATMAGFGPRYLHSTGQLHKGGPSGVRALVVLDPPTDDVPIPNTPYGFARLVAAQAAGDAQALEDANRRVLRTSWAKLAAWAEG